MKHIGIACVVASFFLFSCNEYAFHKTIYYEDVNFTLQLDKSGNSTCGFTLINKTSKEKIYGEASLIVIDEIVPECGLVEDYNDPGDIVGYQCDSTYSFSDSKINMSFALEIKNRERLDLEIWQSTMSGFPVGGYTLRKTDTDWNRGESPVPTNKDRE